MILTKAIFRAEREKRGMTQKQFAKILGYNWQTVRAKELGHRAITQRDKVIFSLIDTLVENNNQI